MDFIANRFKQFLLGKSQTLIRDLRKKNAISKIAFWAWLIWHWKVKGQFSFYGLCPPWPPICKKKNLSLHPSEQGEIDRYFNKFCALPSGPYLGIPWAQLHKSYRFELIERISKLLISLFQSSCCDTRQFDKTTVSLMLTMLMIVVSCLGDFLLCEGPGFGDSFWLKGLTDGLLLWKSLLFLLLGLQKVTTKSSNTGTKINATNVKAFAVRSGLSWATVSLDGITEAVLLASHSLNPLNITSCSKQLDIKFLECWKKVLLGYRMGQELLSTKFWKSYSQTKNKGAIKKFNDSQKRKWSTFRIGTSLYINIFL